MIDGEFSRLRLQGMLDQLYQDQETAHNQELARQEALQKQLESVNYAMPTAQASSSYGDWNPMTGAPGNTIGSTITGTTNGIDPNDPYGIKSLLGKQTTPKLTGAEALGPHVTWDGVDKRVPGDPFGIRQLLANAGTNTLNNLNTTNNNNTTTTNTTAPTNTPVVQNSINGTNNPYNLAGPNQTKTTTTQPLSNNQSITGDDDPYGIKALLNKQRSGSSGDALDNNSITGNDDPYGIKALLKQQQSNKQDSSASFMYKNNVPRETQSFNTSGSGLGSLIRGA